MGDEKEEAMEVFDPEAGDLATTDAFVADDVLDSLAKTGDYLSRLQLCSGNSGLVQEDKIAQGHWAYITSKDDFIDLTPEVQVMALAARPKAARLGEVVVENFDPESDEFKQIMEDSLEQDSGCVYGVEFLCWVPSIKRFATLHLNSKSARKEAKNVQALANQPAVLGKRLADNGKYKWLVPTIQASSAPFTEMPTKQDVVEQVEKFKNPKVSSAETEEAPSDERAV